MLFLSPRHKIRATAEREEGKKWQVAEGGAGWSRQNTLDVERQRRAVGGGVSAHGEI